MNDVRKSIGWADYSWNPIKGLCPEECIYCYACRTYERFGWDKNITLVDDKIERYGRVPDGSRIFVCSTMELFHPDVPSSYRDYVFTTIVGHPEHTFIILTKRPEKIDRPMPKNVWLGVSITARIDVWRWEELQGHEATVKFVSFEPILGAVPYLDPLPDWAIIGRMTGHGRRYDPEIETLSDFYDIYVGLGPGIPIFVKHNLAGIWPGELIQEFPRERRSSHE